MLQLLWSNTARPFIYLSEHVALVDRAEDIILAAITELAQAHNTSSPDKAQVAYLWREKTLTPKSQLTKFRPNMLSFAGKDSMAGKPNKEGQYKWLDSVAFSMLEAFLPPSIPEIEYKPKALALSKKLNSYTRYSARPGIHDFVKAIKEGGAEWGVLSNSAAPIKGAFDMARLKPYNFQFASPGMFKPMPSFAEKALQQIPRRCRGLAWFVGSADVPYDNFIAKEMRNCLLTSDGTSEAKICLELESTSPSNYFKISELSELLPFLIPQPWPGSEDIDRELEIKQLQALASLAPPEDGPEVSSVPLPATTIAEAKKQ